MQTAAGDFVFEQTPDCRGDIFAGRDFAGEFRNLVVQEAMIHALHDFVLQDALQFLEVEHHSRARFVLAGDGDF